MRRGGSKNSIRLLEVSTPLGFRFETLDLDPPGQVPNFLSEDQVRHLAERISHLCRARVWYRRSSRKGWHLKIWCPNLCGEKICAWRLCCDDPKRLTDLDRRPAPLRNILWDWKRKIR